MRVALLSRRSPLFVGMVPPGEGRVQEQGGAGKEGKMKKNYRYVLGSTLRRWGIEPQKVIKVGKETFLCEEVPSALLDRRQKKEGGLFILMPLNQ